MSTALFVGSTASQASSSIGSTTTISNSSSTSETYRLQPCNHVVKKILFDRKNQENQTCPTCAGKITTASFISNAFEAFGPSVVKTKNVFNSNSDLPPSFGKFISIQGLESFSPYGSHYERYKLRNRSFDNFFSEIELQYCFSDNGLFYLMLHFGENSHAANTFRRFCSNNNIIAAETNGSFIFNNLANKPAIETIFNLIKERSNLPKEAVNFFDLRYK